MVVTAASVLLLMLLAVCQGTLGLPAQATPVLADDVPLHHPVRVRRTLVEGVAKAILDPFHILDRHRGSGSSAHSDSVNVGGSLPFGISGGISISSSDARSAAGGAASAGSSSSSGGGSSGGNGYQNNYSGADSMASAGS